jgi:hypothetical protein
MVITGVAAKESGMPPVPDEFCPLSIFLKIAGIGEE